MIDISDARLLLVSSYTLIHLTADTRNLGNEHAHAWCAIDLKKQCIAYHWSQKCTQCEGESKPWFDEQALERIAIDIILCCGAIHRKHGKDQERHDDDSIRD